MEEYLITGKLLKARGLKGEIGIEPFAEDLTRYKELQRCFLEDAQGRILEELKVETAKVEGQKVFLKFHSYDSREDAAKLTNHYISVKREDAVKLEEKDSYVADLIACRVYDKRHGYLGKVAEILRPPQQTLLLLRLEGEADLYMPYLKQSMVKLDLENSRLDVELPDGLWELYRS